jgi:hypothetical protein
MKKLLTMVAVGFTVMSLMSTSASADVTKGKKLYSKKVRKYCGFNGAEFAKKHTQDEWEEIYESGKFAEEMGKICPKGKSEFTKFKKKYLENIYDFAYEYASDSGQTPSCN